MKTPQGRDGGGAPPRPLTDAEMGWVLEYMREVADVCLPFVPPERVPELLARVDAELSLMAGRPVRLDRGGDGPKP